MKKAHPLRMLRAGILGLVRLIFSKTLWFSAAGAVLSAGIFSTLILSRVVYIVDGNHTRVSFHHFSNLHDVKKLLEANQIVTTENDRIEYRLPEYGKPGEVVIRRGFPVTVTADGETQTLNWIEGTVEQLLRTAEVRLGPHDKISLPLGHVLAPYEDVEIVRVAYRSYEVEVKVEKTVTRKGTSLIKLGKTKVLQTGSDGLRVDFYDEILENGEVVETVQTGSRTVKEVTEEIILVGDGSAISSLDYSAQFPLKDGIPVKYKKVLTHQRATGYWRAGRPWGASGGRCFAGTVAVRANEIPYGTKMYIRTPDGKFIYGYAVANDTGTALMDGIIDVDLFYDTYEESCLNGVRWVDIYILE